MKATDNYFLNGDASYVTPNPIALTYKVIKVVSGYFVGVFIRSGLCDTVKRT